jgi:FMN phosphatase YigB (HAD superfamily)
MALRYVVLDFDGTCTQIEPVHDKFLTRYCEILEDANGMRRGELDAAWHAARGRIRDASPGAGWTLAGAPSTAPAAADPYILAFEASALLVRTGAIRAAPATAYADAYAAHPAPWRPEVADVLARLVGLGLRVCFISNSEPAVIKMRLGDLLHRDPALLDQIAVYGNASKFVLRELPIGATGPADAHRARFEALDGAVRARGSTRPIYLRRGAYFEALCRMWDKLGVRDFPVEHTLVCGDIWELDLAMPQRLGAAVHLIERAAPFETYAYEREWLADPRDASRDLRGLVEHAERLRA